MIKNKNTISLSLNLSIAILTCNIFWFIYAFSIGDYFLLIPQACGLVLSTIQLFLKFHYRLNDANFFKSSKNTGKTHELNDDDDTKATSTSTSTDARDVPLSSFTNARHTLDNNSAASSSTSTLLTNARSSSVVNVHLNIASEGSE